MIDGDSSFDYNNGELSITFSDGTTYTFAKIFTGEWYDEVEGIVLSIDEEMNDGNNNIYPTTTENIDPDTGEEWGIDPETGELYEEL